MDLAPRGLEPFLGEEAPVEDGGAAVRHARGLHRLAGLAARDRVHVQSGAPGSRRHDRHPRLARLERGLQLEAHGLQDRGHLVDGAHAEEWHAAVSGPPVRRDLEPPHAAVPDAHAIDSERLGDDHVVGAPARDVAALAEPGDTRVAAALLVHRAADLEPAPQAHAGAPHRFGRVDRRRDPGLHVARAAAVEPAVADDAGEGLDAPAVARRHHVEVPVQVEAGPGAVALEDAEDVRPRVAGRVLGASLRREDAHREAAANELVADRLRCVGVGFAGWVHGGNPHERRREIHGLGRAFRGGGRHARAQVR